MASHWLLGMGLLTLLGASPAAEPSRAEPDRDLARYEALRDQAGRDAGSQVKLALWCEAHGLNAERAKHLTLAVLTDPTHVTARGLLGLVAYRGKWVAAEKLRERIKDDETLSAKLAAYNQRRAWLEDHLADEGRSAKQKAHNHVGLGMWCERNGLKAEATAHFTAAVVLYPYNETTWKHLGYIKHEGRWVTREQLAADRQEAKAQQEANKKWESLFRTWRAGLADPSKRAEAESELAKVDDPRAVPEVVRVFGSGSETDQNVARQLLGQIDTPESTRRLAELAVFGTTEAVRSAATAALKGREPREYAGLLVNMIRAPMKYQAQPVAGPGSLGALLVMTPRFKMLRTYEAPPAFELSSQFFGYVGYDMNGLPVAARGVELRKMAKESPATAAGELAAIEERTAELIAAANFKAMVSQQRLSADVVAIESSNARTLATNARIAPVLAANLDAPAELKDDDEDGWKTWWNDRLGYKYEPEPQQVLAVNASPQYPPPRLYSCFVAGTPVRTIDGLRPIESLNVGDQVLTQDTASGELSYQLIQVVHHNAPNETVRVGLDNGETLVPSIYHRFWRAGKGWALARDLQTGDVLRTLGGRAKIVSVAPGLAEPLFNLDVAKTRTFFVGAHGALVHDNTLPETRLRPFDAEPDAEVIAKGGR